MLKQMRVIVGCTLCGMTFLACSVLSQASAQINFGNDASQWANDGECDDPRFEGNGMASTLLNDDRFHDATDCRRLYSSNDIRLIPGTRGELTNTDTNTDGRYVDKFSFAVPDGPGPEKMYVVEVRSVRLDTVLELYDESGERIGWNDDYRNDKGHSYIERRLSSGTYSIGVTTYHKNQIGTYVLVVREVYEIVVDPITTID